MFVLIVGHAGDMSPTATAAMLPEGCCFRTDRWADLLLGPRASRGGIGTAQCTVCLSSFLNMSSIFKRDEKVCSVYTFTGSVSGKADLLNMVTSAYIGNEVMLKYFFKNYIKK